MARRVFFSFHFQRDIFRANVVRNSWVTRDREAAGFFDASLWEEAQTKGDAAVRAIIAAGLRNTSVTVVLIGKETASRPYVKYEIEQSIARGNGLLGIRIEKIKDIRGNVDDAGPNPLPAGYPMYLWNKDDGYTNLGVWVERAAKAAGK
ncbi:TIR domain-containing protein [Microbacterium sp. NPDC055910]|uniref:TIR domain-containing protein n=1 Tax=Microbacterium sp. NPDC055910 TaxID=3345659 RepID=UPI0035D542D8